MMPSTGRDWNTVRGTSPVPGGMSTNITSTWPQTMSVQNCLTVLAMTGPRKTTGSSSFSSNRDVDMMRTPYLLSLGSRPSPSRSISGEPLTPNMRGMEGPVISASSTAADRPFFCTAQASREVTRDLPTPPLPETTPMTRFTVDFSLPAIWKLFSSHLSLQELQL